MRRMAIGVAAVAAFLMIAVPAHAQSDKDVQQVIKQFEKGDPGMQAWFREAHGYAVFPSVGKGAVGVGGAHGKGLVYERGALIGKTSLTAVTKAGASKDLGYKKGVAIMTATKGGLMYEASVGGQKFSYEKIKN